MDLTGIIDLHIHTGPDVRPRLLDDIAAARAAADAGMRAILIKSHVTCTADRAAIAQSACGRGLRVLGGLALNTQVGGFNPSAVEAAITLGAVEVWMPTFSARGRGATGLTIWDEAGVLLPEVQEVLKQVAEARIILGTGHLAVAETVALVRAARAAGVERILVTHPDSTIVGMPVDVQLELAQAGAFFERCFVATRETPPVTIQYLAGVIRRVGVESTVLSTDFGQAHNPPPVEGFRAYLSGLAAEGFSATDLRRMAADNPAVLIA